MIALRCASAKQSMGWHRHRAPRGNATLLKTEDAHRPARRASANFIKKIRSQEQRLQHITWPSRSFCFMFIIFVINSFDSHVHSERNAIRHSSYTRRKTYEEVASRVRCWQGSVSMNNEVSCAMRFPLPFAVRNPPTRNFRYSM